MYYIVYFNFRLIIFLDLPMTLKIPMVQEYPVTKQAGTGLFEPLSFGTMELNADVTHQVTHSTL